ncbi:transcription elongation factor S-II protein [Cooperia oncophora]
MQADLSRSSVEIPIHHYVLKRLVGQLSSILTSLQLQKTRIGMTINDLRKKTSDEKLAKKAKNLIKEWKNLVDKREDKKRKGT